MNFLSFSLLHTIAAPALIAGLFATPLHAAPPMVGASETPHTACDQARSPNCTQRGTFQQTGVDIVAVH